MIAVARNIICTVFILSRYNLKTLNLRKIKISLFFLECI